MPVSRTGLVVSVITFIACLLALAWIVIGLSDMQNRSKKICAKEGGHGLTLLNTFINQLPNEIPVYPKAVLPANSPAVLFAQSLVDKGDISRLTLLDRNERSIFSAGRASAGVYSPFTKLKPAYNEGFLLEDMSGVAVVVPIGNNGAAKAMAGIVLPMSAEMDNFQIFHNYYQPMIVIVVILLLVSGSVLLTKALKKPVNPLLSIFLTLKSRWPDLSSQAPGQDVTDEMAEPVKITIKSLQQKKYTETGLAEETQTPPARQELNIAATDLENENFSYEPTSSETTGETGLPSDLSPQLCLPFENAFADLAKQRDVTNIEFYRSCQEQIPAIAIDPDELRQVLISLMLNAHDSMPAGGKLVVRAKLDSNEEGTSSEQLVRIDVLDTGTGLSGKQQAKIFNPSYKPRSLPKEMVPRLAHARNIIERSGGKIDVKSKVGKGSCFTVWLPCNQRWQQT